MKRSSLIIAMLMVLTALAVHFAMAQPGDVTPPAGFNYIFFVPYLIGTLLHWFKKYKETGGTVTFGAWYFNNLFMSVTSLAVGVGTMYLALGGMQSNPQTWLLAFWNGVGADSINQTTKPA